MKTSIRFVLGITFACLAFHASAQPNQMVVSDLGEFCSAHDDSSISACRFYILGVMEGLGLGSAYEAQTQASKAHFCIPYRTGQSETVSLVKQQMRQDLAMFPQDKTLPAVSFISAVLMKAYPCPR